MRKHFIAILIVILTFLFSFNVYVEARDSISDKVNFIDIYQQEYGTTQANDEYPVLKTIGAATCIAVILFDPISKVGSMAHIATVDGDWLQGMFLSMKHAGYKDTDRTSVEVYIIGGRKGISDKMYQLISRSLFSFSFSNIVETDYGSFKAGNVALDTRTGIVYNLINIIQWVPPKNEKERLRRKIRDLMALMPDVHYTDDDKAKKYESF